MSWICPHCETENPDKLRICEVCNSPRKLSPVDQIKERLKNKYNESEYRYIIQYHYGLLECADKGNPDAQYQVGKWFYEHGDTGTTKLYDASAVIWFSKAAAKSHTDAQLYLALCYEDGRGVNKSKEDAVMWYKRASTRNKLALHKYLKLKYDKKAYEQVIRYRNELLYAADGGNSDSQYQLGEWFSKHNSQAAYRDEAYLWYSLAAKKGNIDAMCKLAECYENGAGVYSNIDEALKWYKKAAKGGNKTMCLRLAESYLYGRWLVDKNVGESVKWGKLAGQSLSGEDFYNIGYAYEIGDTVAIDINKAVEYYRKAAEKGHAIAQYNMGVFYENAMPAKVEQAKYWHEKAAAQGYKKSKERLSEIKKEQFVKLLCNHAFGIMYGGVGYYVWINIVPQWGINVPFIWPNTFPTNFIICMVIGIIGAAYFIKKE